eukprot:2951862-Amphidinium_carterae.1
MPQLFCSPALAPTMWQRGMQPFQALRVTLISITFMASPRAPSLKLMPYSYEWLKLEQTGDTERTATPRAGSTAMLVKRCYLRPPQLAWLTTCVQGHSLTPTGVGFVMFGGMDGRRNDQGTHVIACICMLMTVMP